MKIKKIRKSFPCENCLVFSMCKSKYAIEFKTIPFRNLGKMIMIDLDELLSSCKTIERWYRKYPKKEVESIILEKYNSILTNWWLR